MRRRAMRFGWWRRCPVCGVKQARPESEVQWRCPECQTMLGRRFWLWVVPLAVAAAVGIAIDHLVASPRRWIASLVAVFVLAAIVAVLPIQRLGRIHRDRCGGCGANVRGDRAGRDPRCAVCGTALTGTLGTE